MIIALIAQNVQLNVDNKTFDTRLRLSNGNYLILSITLKNVRYAGHETLSRPNSCSDVYKCVQLVFVTHDEQTAGHIADLRQ